MMLELVNCQLKLFVSLGETLATMEETEFSQHVEALATKRLEKPKKLSVRNGRFWSEILSQHFNFDRDEIEVISFVIKMICSIATCLAGCLLEVPDKG